MSSCVASCCICFPRALCASATSVSSPVAAELNFCRSALQYSTPHQRKPKQQHPPPRTSAPTGSVPSVAVPWQSSKDSQPLRSNFARRPTCRRLQHEVSIQFRKVHVLRRVPQIYVLPP